MRVCEKRGGGRGEGGDGTALYFLVVVGKKAIIAADVFRVGERERVRACACLRACVCVCVCVCVCTRACV